MPAGPPDTAGTPIYRQPPTNHQGPTTMADKPSVPTFDWRIRLKGEADSVPVHAAYFGYSGNADFLEFKNGQHKIIYVVAIDQVLDIGRHSPDRVELDIHGRRIPDAVLDKFTTTVSGVVMYAVRVDDRNNTHPSYLGPFTRQQMDELGERLTAAGRTWEAGLLYQEADLPGLWKNPDGIGES